MSAIKDFINEHDRFARMSGIELVEVNQGSALARMTIQEMHLNGLDMVHGGALFTLADLAFAAASNSRGQAAVGINASISYIRPAKAGTVLSAQASEIFSHRTLSGYSVEVKNDQDKLVATFQGTAFKKDFPLVPGA
ncbi:thioesterase superfamily protein [Desulfonatronospira thiodismutans ASO3-1]|uniref:Thioesterase superfamily protein n=1 Tax=Desulfonatronospira thiodismutans ASO3-1 TaxID=555779 RepID=D6SNJ2_9BACT|nr:MULTISPECIES: hotdog fold thioesterase [Desulfonatronospira]EFI34318.1 thioesterase superfamily protein [Desulfonatronospira thiodismutans ASO3-1]RQD79160.1 MAG: hotdog fold thioesterase [Desulfonatronospira sp. MSAO_Bac3]